MRELWNSHFADFEGQSKWRPTNAAAEPAPRESFASLLFAGGGFWASCLLCKKHKMIILLSFSRRIIPSHPAYKVGRRRFCEKRNWKRRDYLWIRIWLLFPAKMISLTTLAYSMEEPHFRHIFFVFLLIYIPLTSLMWLEGFHVQGCVLFRWHVFWCALSFSLWKGVFN